MRTRTVGINIRLTPQEKKRIERYAKKCSLSVSEYLRKLANGYEPAEIPSDNFYLVAQDLEIMIQDFKGRDDELLRDLLTTCVYDLYETYLYGRSVKQNGNNENMADS